MNQANYQLVMPLNLEVLITENDSVRLVSHVVEELDLRSLNMAYSSKGRNPAAKPRVLFSVLVYAYMNGLYGSRQIERACKRDINFMWLLGGSKAPDHNTIDRFRRERLSSCLEDLFSQFVEKLYQWDEISFDNLYIDGTKIEANANKYSFVWKKVIEKSMEKQPVKVTALLCRIDEEFCTTFQKQISDTILCEVASFLLKKKDEMAFEFVSGIGRKKSLLQKLTEDCLALLERKEYYEKCRDTFGNRNSFSKTDKHATFMHMKDDHMRNSQLKPGYNMQIGVEAGYVVHCQTFQDRNDVGTLIPFMESLKRQHPLFSFKNIVADAGYESEENYDYLQSEKKNIYIKPQTYEQWKKRSFKKLIGKRENMVYDADSDIYTCSQGRKLILKRTYDSKLSTREYVSKISLYECESCQDCPSKPKCTKAEGNRTIKVSKKFMKLRELSLSNIMSAKGVVLRLNRSIQAEGAFGVLKEDMGFRRFLTRGHASVSTEFMLLCFAFNINKYHRKILNDRCGFKIYHEDILKKSA